MANVFGQADVLQPPAQGAPGLLGDVQQPDWVSRLGLLGAGLQDGSGTFGGNTDPLYRQQADTGNDFRNVPGGGAANFVSPLSQSGPAIGSYNGPVQQVAVPGDRPKAESFWDRLGHFASELAGITPAHAQAGAPLPYSLRAVPSPAFEPGNLPGMDLEGKERVTNLKEALGNMKDQTEIGQDLSEIGARGRQSNVTADFYGSQRAYDPPLIQNNYQEIVGPGGISATGKGNTWKTPFGTYYVDRNGDTYPDIEIRYDGSGKAQVNYGDGRGFIPYNPKGYLPAPPAPLSPAYPKPAYPPPPTK
jgi:hypothetical protein